MVKYIDLLRSHQQSDSHQDSVSQKGDAKLGSLLADEELQTTEASPAPSQDNNSLLIDEDASVAETTQTQVTQQHNATAKIALNSPCLSDCIQHILTLFQHAQQNIAFDTTPLHKCVSTLLEQLIDNPDMLDELELNIVQQTQQISSIDNELGSLVQKSIVMMLYAIKVGQRLKLDFDELRANTLAAMLHHIGMAQIPYDIRNKQDKLSTPETNDIKQAAQNGYQYLEKCGVTDPCILHAASQSSERFDGSGEKGLKGSNIAWSARLTAALSMFESLTHYRPYRARLLARDAIREIVKHHKKSFDPTIIKAMIESISLYPIGTYVQLNSEEIGMVIHIHPYLPLRPVVNVEMDSQAREIPPRQVDLKEQPNLTIEKCMYKEALADLRENPAL